MRSVETAPESDFGPWGEFARGLFLTNRCGNARTPGCNRALTKLDILAAFGANPRHKTVCTCGCNSWRSSNFKWWEALLLWRSWKQWIAYKRGMVSPNPSRESIEDNSASLLKAAMSMAEAEEAMAGEDDE